jgi:hypothetical protein
MRPYTAVILWLILAANTAVAAELTPVVRDRQLGVAIRALALALPTTMGKDLVSGLTNTLLIHVELLSGSNQVDQRTAEIAIRYDLWDETFKLIIAVNDAVVTVRPNSTPPEIDAFLADIRLPDLFAVTEMPADKTATLRVEVLLNPIERQRVEAIKQWVADNSTYTPADTPGFSDKRVGSARSNAIFNRIFEQYARGADVAAIWKESLSSKPFKIGELRDER